MQVASRVQIANQISAIFVHVSMQAEFDILLPQLFEKGILDDLVVPCDGMMPGCNTQDVRVLSQSPIGLGGFDLFCRLEQSNRQRAFMPPRPILVILINLPCRVHGQKLAPVFLEETGLALYPSFGLVGLLNQGVIELAEVLKLCVIPFIIPYNKAIGLLNIAPCLQFPHIDPAFLPPFIDFVILAQVVITRHNHTTCRGDFQPGN
jgi:hypothetical protein